MTTTQLATAKRRTNLKRQYASATCPGCYHTVTLRPDYPALSTRVCRHCGDWAGHVKAGKTRSGGYLVQIEWRRVV